MRLVNSVFSAASVVAALAALLGPASANGRDYVYADSFGNLVIESAAGYKRILVGAGHDIDRIMDYERGPGPAPSASAEQPGDQECYRPAVLVKGRSYMYGFDQGVIPTLGAPCL